VPAPHGHHADEPDHENRDRPASTSGRTHLPSDRRRSSDRHPSDRHSPVLRSPERHRYVPRSDASRRNGRNRLVRRRNDLRLRSGGRPRTDDALSRPKAGWSGWNRSCQQSSHTWRETSDRARYPQVLGTSQFGRPARRARGQKCHERKPKRLPLVREIRRRPTLPGTLVPSTIGAGGLNFRVRDGNGCDPSAMATEICCQLTSGGPVKRPVPRHSRTS
jgi:hypothetical protein